LVVEYNAVVLVNELDAVELEVNPVVLELCPILVVDDMPIRLFSRAWISMFILKRMFSMRIMVLLKSSISVMLKNIWTADKLESSV
jgi:hypothetical protein